LKNATSLDSGERLFLPNNTRPLPLSDYRCLVDYNHLPDIGRKFFPPSPQSWIAVFLRLAKTPSLSASSSPPVAPHNPKALSGLISFVLSCWDWFLYLKRDSALSLDTQSGKSVPSKNSPLIGESSFFSRSIPFYLPFPPAGYTADCDSY